MKKVVIFLANGFEEVEAITPADFLRRSDVTVILAGVTGKTVTGAHGIKIECDLEVSKLNGSYDGVIIPGGMPGGENRAKKEKSIVVIERALD